MLKVQSNAVCKIAFIPEKTQVSFKFTPFFITIKSQMEEIRKHFKALQLEDDNVCKFCNGSHCFQYINGERG